MSSNRPKLDPLTLQRLIDGELDTQQVQEVLLQAQASPEQWKSIAVGFIENQAWQGTFNSNFAETDSDHVSDNTPEPVASAAADRNSLRKSSIGWLAIAASLLAAASIGYMTSQAQNQNVPGNSIAENKSNDSPVKPKLTTAALTSDLTPDFHIEVPRAPGFDGLGARNQVPIYRVTNADQLRQLRAQREIESEFPRRIMEQLSDSGYQIEQEIEFVSGQVDNQSFIVPLRTIRLIPGQ